MPGNAAPVDEEKGQLLAFLDQQRLVIRLAAYGLSDDQARATPSASELSVGGLIKHVANVERAWMDTVLGRPSADGDQDEYRGFRPGPDESLQSILDDYTRAGAATDEIVGSLDLDRPVPVPRGVPWFPDDLDAWSVRWVVLHLITETARHAGHADIVRETIDGASAFPLMAAAEGWPATPWMQPCSPDPG